MSLLLKIFINIPSFRVWSQGFWGFLMVRFQLMFLKLSSLNRSFQELFHGILYFSVAQKVIDFVLFTRLRILGILVDLKNGKLWSLLSLMF